MTKLFLRIARCLGMQRMEKHWQYLRYVLIHKWYVLVAGIGLDVPIWQLIVHDLSKFRPSEWIPYVDYFYGGKKLPRIAFDMAWLLHQRRNAHHWQHWLLRQDSGDTIPLEMPEKYVREMVADWVGAGRAITGKIEVDTWYDKNRDRIILHPNSRRFAERLIVEFVLDADSSY